MNRRKFLGLLSASGVALAVTPTKGEAATTAEFKGHPDAMGVLHDSSLCIGCRQCEAACQKVNSDELPEPEVPFDDLTVLNSRRRTVGKESYTVVNKYEVAGKEHPIFRKQQCNHCLEPACASACFVKAFVKTPEGPVVYRPSLCVGCRYCLIACPYTMPTYDYNSAIRPLVYKCTMCAPLIAEGKVPGCVDKCPSGALVFGKRSDLLKIARKRIADNPTKYVETIYGEHEVGGSNWLYLSPVEHTKLGQPELNKTSIPELTSGALSAPPMVAGLWPVLLGGAYAITKRRNKVADMEQDEAVASAVAATEAAAETKLEAAMAKAKKDTENSVAKAKKDAVKEYEAKLAAEAEAQNEPADADAPEEDK